MRVRARARVRVRVRARARIRARVRLRLRLRLRDCQLTELVGRERAPPPPSPPPSSSATGQGVVETPPGVWTVVNDRFLFLGVFCCSSSVIRVLASWSF